MSPEQEAPGLPSSSGWFGGMIRSGGIDRRRRANSEEQDANFEARERFLQSHIFSVLAIQFAQCSASCRASQW
jgi:hypothetical protein